MNFEFLTGDKDWMGCGAKWISERQNNGEFNYWVVVDFANMEDDRGFGHKYYATAAVVAPSRMTRKEWAAALDSVDGDQEYFDRDGRKMTPAERKQREHMAVEIVHSYNGGALLWQGQGNNAKKLLEQAKEEGSTLGGMFFGFSMDKDQNAMGATGWDKLKGHYYPWEK